MKASEIIALVEKIKAEHGDVDIFLNDDNDDPLKIKDTYRPYTEPGYTTRGGKVIPPTKWVFIDCTYQNLD